MMLMYIIPFLRALLLISFFPIIVCCIGIKRYDTLKKLSENCIETEAEILSVRTIILSEWGHYGPRRVKRCHILFRYTVDEMEFQTDKEYSDSTRRKMEADIQRGRTIICVNCENLEKFELKDAVEKRKTNLYYCVAAVVAALLFAAYVVIF